MPRSAYKADPRTYFKTFRFTAAELTRLENRARARRQSLSTYVRATLFDRDEGAAPEGKPALEPADYPVQRSRASTGRDRSLTNQLRKIGTNLNQIAHRMNERHIPTPRDLPMLLDQIRDIVRQAREA